MTKNQTILKIAREVLDLATLETRNSDALDFREQAVWQIAKALDVAYEAGRATANPPRGKHTTTTARPRP